MFTPATLIGSDPISSSHLVKRTQPRHGFYRAVAIVTTFAMVFGGLLLMPMPAAAASATTTDRLNLRSGPGLDQDVIAVIPEGASITVDGDPENGYFPVSYDGVSGYAAADYISVGGGSESGDAGDGGAPVSGGAPTGSAYVAVDRLNFRSGPSLGDGVITVLSNGDAVELTGQQSNGYWQATANGTTGWIAAAYLTTSGAPSNPDPDTDTDPAPDTGSGGGSVPVGDSATGSATVTASLNLRSGPGTDYAVRTVMRSGASVELRGDPQGGFYPLSYNGTTGWAAGDWLDIGGSNPAPDPEPDTDDGGGSVAVGDTATGSATVTAGLNLRSGPGLDYGVRTVMPSGASVELRGDSQGGYYPVSYNGTTGWAAGDWLDIGGSTPAPEPAPEPDTGDGSVPVGDAVTGSATVTAGLNLRSGPSLDYGVRTIMPSGASVELRGDSQGGYYPVSYNGTAGWAAGDWLDIGGSTPAPDPDPTPDPGTGNGNGETPRYLYTTAAVNMRSGPTINDSIVWVLPPNTRVNITGAAQNSYYPAEWAHVSGWVHGDFLSRTYQGPSTEGKEDIIAIIHEAADYYGQPRADMVRVAQCESHLDPSAINRDYPNDPNSARGLFQFRPSTWATTPYADQDIFDARANAFAAAWMWDNGRRNEWACQ